MILGRFYTRNVYPQLLNNFTRNDLVGIIPTVAYNFTRNDLGKGIIPAMFTRSRLTTFPAMI